MNSKTGIALVVVGGVLVACCGGGFFLAKSATEQVQKTISKNKEFVKESLSQIGATWDPKVFDKYADASFKSDEKNARTEKMFVVFKQKLGKLQLLEEVEPDQSKKPFEIVSAQGKQAFLSRLTAKAKFEKGEGVFKVTVQNIANTQSILEIALNSDQLFDLPKEDLEKAKERLKSESAGTKK